MDYSDAPQDNRSKRILRVEKSLREVIGQQLMSMNALFEGALVTLVRVSCSPDLRNAEAFVSVFAGEGVHEDDAIDHVFDVLEEQRALIQHRIGKDLPMKFCPKVKFTLDGSIDKLVHFSEVLNESKSETSTHTESD